MLVGTRMNVEEYDVYEEEGAIYKGNGKGKEKMKAGKNNGKNKTNGSILTKYCS